MISRSLITQAVRYLADYKLRTALTTLGILVAVAAIVTFTVLSAGLQADVLETVAGDNKGTVYTSVKRVETNGPPIVGQGSAPVFTEHDVERLEELRGVRTVIPLGREQATVTFGEETLDRREVRTTPPPYFRTIRGEKVAKGRMYKRGRSEVVINQGAATMFSEPIRVGDTLTMQISSETFEATVVGIIEDEPTVTQQVTGDPVFPLIYAPPDPFYQRVARSPSEDAHQRVYTWVFVVSKRGANPQLVRERVSTYLHEESDARTFVDRGQEFSVATYDQWVDHVEQLSTTLTAYTLSVAIVSLIVGAIGIANIMLVSVTERVREIGVMRAVGAQNRDVMKLFLTEATVIGTIGGVLGILVGLASGRLMTHLLEMPFIVDPLWTVSGVAIGLLTGLLAGVYPAWHAAHLDPIDALRHE
jgi:putative ABC transport system permease protein